MSPLRRTAILGVLLLLCSAFTLDHPPTVDELVAGSARIVSGRVVDQRTRFDARTRLILTDTQVEVDAWLKGSGGRVITVTEVGGVLNGVTLENPGRAAFRKGETVVVFLVDRETGGMRTYYGPYGKLGAQDVALVTSSIQRSRK